MDDLFESYSQDYTQIANGVREKLAEGGEARSLKGEPRKSLLRRLTRELEEAEEILSQLEIELQSSNNASLKAKRNTQVRAWKGELNKWRGETKTLMSTSDRDDLLSGSTRPSHTSITINSSGTSSPDLNSTHESDQRTRLLRGTQMLSDGQRRLDDSERIALETEDLGAGILRDLRGQREQIEGTRDTLQTADRNIDRASGTLGKMIRRMYRQRVVTGLIILVLVVLIIVVLYAKLK